jgi:hypothetical protein
MVFDTHTSTQTERERTDRLTDTEEEIPTEKKPKTKQNGKPNN